MEAYIPLMKKSPIFAKIKESDLEELLKCLSARTKQYEKGQHILTVGEQATFTGMLLTGQVHIIKEDFLGNKGIIAQVVPGEIFGEAFSFMETKELPISVVAVEKTKVLFLDYKKIITMCTSSCGFHGQLIKNLIRILSQKNILLTEKIDYISRRTTREKLIAYLSEAAFKAGKNTFTIPFNRQQLADYLAIDRSAMSLQLCKMRDEGLIEFEKNKFKIVDIAQK
ncbi:MAG: Crp/Fnr family transcriptional regulator [Anaerovoracaceae bacterium]